MEQPKLTLDALRIMGEGTVFKRGKFVDSPAINRKTDDLNVGDYVHCIPSIWEYGRVKELKGNNVYVVYKCGCNWKNFTDYTGVRTPKADLEIAKNINFSGSGQLIKWVAKRGFIHDWAIYVAPDDWAYSEVITNGNKLHTENSIKQLMPCDDEAFGMYRY